MLVKATLLHTFGAHANNPARKTTLQLGGLSLLALTSSIALATLAGELPLLQAPTNMYALAATMLFATQLVVLVTLVAASGSISRMHGTMFARWLLLLPVSPLWRWAILMLPAIVLAALALLLAAWPMSSLWLQIGAPPFLICMCLLGGALSALGLVYALPPRISRLRIPLVLFVLYLQYTLVSTLHDPYISNAAVAWAFGALVLAQVAAWPMSSLYVPQAIRRVPAHPQVRYLPLPTSWWFVKKAYRSRSWRVSYGSGLALCIGIAFVGNKYMVEPATLTLCTALVLAACIADLRGLSRIRNPAEIAGLKGAAHFCSQQLTTAIIASVSLAVPLFIVLDDTNITTIAPLVTGLAAGLSAGTLLAPTAHDISSQFLASVLCLVILVMLPAVPIFPEQPALLAATHLCLASLLLCAMYGIEYLRNPYTWRRPQ